MDRCDILNKYVSSYTFDMTFAYDRMNKKPSSSPSSEGLEGRRLTVPPELFIPYGEPFVDQHVNSAAFLAARYTFSGKERDEETGYSNFGARYLDASLLSSWFSVDPMADKYPSISPYNYCAWNPIKLVDPDGQIIILPKNTSIKNIYLVLGSLQKLTDDRLVYSTQKDGTIRIKIASLGKGDKPVGTTLIRRLNSSKKTVTIDVQNSQKNFEYDEGNRAKAINPKDVSNGIGSDAIVSFDPTFNPDILTKDSKTGSVSYKKRPNQLGLGHELIHAEHYMDGDRINSPEKSNYSSLREFGIREIV